MATNNYLEIIRHIRTIDEILGITHSISTVTPEIEEIFPSTGQLPELTDENLIGYFPDAFCKETDSNNEKLLKLVSTPLLELRKTIRQVYDANDIFKATGKTLDYYGDIYSVQRNELTDDQYRYVILSVIARNNAGVDHESIIQAITVVFNCNSDEIQISDHSDTPATVKVEKMPFSIILNAGFTPDEAKEIIENLMPTTVSIDIVNFEGSFEFGENYDDYDEDKGFSDSHENPTVGGFFGAYYG